jgi:hypothetical protein
MLLALLVAAYIHHTPRSVIDKDPDESTKHLVDIRIAGINM